MMLENADENIQQAQKHESLIYAGKKQAYHELQKSIDRRFGEDLLDHRYIKNYAIEVSPSYESSSISLNIYIRLAEEQQEILEEIQDKFDYDDKGYRISHHFKDNIQEELKRRFIDEWDLQTDIYLRVVDKERFERMKDK